MGYLPELRSLLSISLPVTFNMLFYRLPWLTSLFFVGRISPEALASAGLASTICNVSGLSLVIGLSGALTTLASQAKGNLSSSSPSSPTATSPVTYLHRALLIHLLFTLPVGIFWQSRSLPLLLTSLGQSPPLAASASAYLALLAPGLWGHTVMFTLTPFCQSMSLPHLPAYSAMAAAVLHPLWNHLLITTLGLGYLGAAAATSLTQCLGPLLLFCYLERTRAGRETLAAALHLPPDTAPDLSLTRGFLASVSSCAGLAQYLRLGLPGLVSISEWWASEVAIFWAGSPSLPSGDPPAVSLSAMSLYQSVNSSCFMFAVGVAVAGATRVGNHLGAGDAAAARFSGKAAVLLSALVSSSIGALLFLSPHSLLPSLLASSAAVVDLTASTIPLLAVYVLADGVQVCLSGLTKGLGLQWMGAPVVVVAYWLVGVPVARYLAFERGMGVLGLVGGMTAGTWVHFVMMGAVVACCVDWEREAGKAKARVGGGGGGEEEVSFVRVAGEEEEGLEMGDVGGGAEEPEDDFFSGMQMRMKETLTPKKGGGYVKVGGGGDLGSGGGEEEEDMDMEALEAMGAVDDDKRDRLGS